MNVVNHYTCIHINIALKTLFRFQLKILHFGLQMTYVLKSSKTSDKEKLLDSLDKMLVFIRFPKKSRKYHYCRRSSSLSKPLISFLLLLCFLTQVAAPWGHCYAHTSENVVVYSELKDGMVVPTLVEQNKCGWKFAPALGPSTALSTGQLPHHCSFSDRTLQGAVQDIWTKGQQGLDSSRRPGIPGLPASCCSPSWPFPISAPPTHNRYTHTHTVSWDLGPIDEHFQILLTPTQVHFNSGPISFSSDATHFFLTPFLWGRWQMSLCVFFTKSNSYHKLSTYFVPSIVLSTLRSLCPWIPATNIWSKNYFLISSFLMLTDKETEA